MSVPYTELAGSAGQNNTVIVLIPPAAIAMLWPKVLDILFAKGQKWLEVVDENDIHQMLVTGQADLWCAMRDGKLAWFGVCMLERHARASYYHVCFVGGEGFLPDIPKVLPLVERHAVMSGAREVVFEARKGFDKMLRLHGYGQTTLRLRKNVQILWSN